MSYRHPFWELQKAIQQRLEPLILAEFPDCTLGTLLLPDTTFPFVVTNRLGFTPGQIKGPGFHGEYPAFLDIFTQEESSENICKLINICCTGLFSAKLELGNGFEMQTQQIDEIQMLPEIHPNAPLQHSFIKLKFRIFDSMGTV